MPDLALIIAVALLLAAAAWLWWRRGVLRRQRSLARLLDLADEMERLLDRSQERMHALQAVVGRVPADIGAVANASLESGLPIREAKRDVLQHRLWIKQHGDRAAQSELDTACAALQRAHERLAGQIQALEQAGADLAEATEASTEAARREPPTLRRPPEG